MSSGNDRCGKPSQHPSSTLLSNLNDFTLALLSLPVTLRLIRLEAIPPSFGNFVRLDRVVLDGNRLRRLPETLSRMKCRFFNVSNNKLVR